MLRLRIRALCVPLCAFAELNAFFLGGCKRSDILQAATSQQSEGQQIKVSLAPFGLPADYARHDDDDCTSHVIGYRFVVWLSANAVAVGFNTSPACRPFSGELVRSGTLRIVVFDASGKPTAQRDLPYGADGGDEIVAPGEAFRGPGHTLLIRLEESVNSQSAALLLAPDLHQVRRIDAFMDTPSVLDRALAFQHINGLEGSLNVDIVGSAQEQPKSTAVELPEGTMARQVQSRGTVFAECTQELSPGKYQASRVIYAGAHRRCILHVQPVGSAPWQASLDQDQVAEILGIAGDRRVFTIVRQSDRADRLVAWSADGRRQQLPWFPKGYDTRLQSATETVDRYQGVGSRDQCAIPLVLCGEKTEGRLMIFDQSQAAPLINRTLPKADRAALSPDGLRYATLSQGELHIFSLPGKGGSRSS